MKHWKDYLDDETTPKALRTFLYWTRLPGQCRNPPADRRTIPAAMRELVWNYPEPLLFAKLDDMVVRVMHAGADGRIFYATDLVNPWAAKLRQQKFVASLDVLTDFTDEPPTPEMVKLRDAYATRAGEAFIQGARVAAIVERAAHAREMKAIRRARRAGVGR